MGCGQGFGFYFLCKRKVIKGFKQGNSRARSVFLESGGRQLEWKQALVARDRGSDHSSLGGQGRGEREERPGVP